MGWEGWFTTGILVVVFAGLMANVAADALLVGAVVAVTLAGVISPSEAFVGFSNTGMLTVAALYVVAAGLRETGALSKVGALMLGKARSERSALVRLGASVPVMSAFLNNTPVVAMFIPVLTDWCKKHQVAPSRLLLPLSYMCILGGTCTLIGTSTNLVVNGLMVETAANRPELAEPLHPMHLFELAKVGLPYAAVGLLYLFFVAPRLLPNRKDFLDRLTDSAREYLLNMRVAPGCSLIGKGVEEAGLRHLPGLFLIEIVRGNEVITPVTPQQVLREGDVLTFTGVVNTIVDIEKYDGLEPVADAAYETRAPLKRGRMLCEAVVSASCPAIGKTIRDADFRALYNAAVVAVHRGSARLKGRVGDIVLRPGDTLLLQTAAHFDRAQRNSRDFLLVSGVADSRPYRHDKALLAISLLGLLLVLLATGWIPTVMAAFLVAGLMVGCRCISVAEARRSLDWQTLITIAAAFGFGRALVASGMVEASAELVVSAVGPLGPVALLAGVYLMTTLFTETITNNAAAALVFPFVIPIAQQIGVSPRPLRDGRRLRRVGQFHDAARLPDQHDGFRPRRVPVQRFPAGRSAVEHSLPDYRHPADTGCLAILAPHAAAGARLKHGGWAMRRAAPRRALPRRRCPPARRRG